MTNLDEPIDIDATDERLFELYKLWCVNNNTKPSLKDYLLWLEERY